MNAVPGRIDTPRLTLRPVEAGDAAAMARLMTAAVSTRLANWPIPFTPERAAKRIADGQAMAAAGNGALYAIVRRADGAFLGCVWVRRRETDRRIAGMGYWLGEEFHGQGYMREAALAARDEGFRRYDFDAIEAGSQPDNAASLATIRALGMKLRGEETHFAPARNRDEPVLYFAVRRDEIAPILGP